jgi:hypothetical protein
MADTSDDTQPGARAGWALGLAGLIPFFATGAALWAGPQRLGPAVFIAPVALLGYAATIASFLGGARWGAEMARGAAARPLVLALSTAPQIAAWLLIVAPLATVYRYGGLMLVIALTAVWDASAPELPGWYRRLRIPLSVGAAAALASGLAWTLVLAQAMARPPHG